MEHCHNCHREGQIKVFSKDNPLIECDICGGTGELPEGMIYDMNKGYAMRIRRIEYFTLRQYCAEHNKKHPDDPIDAAERSKQERGYFSKKD